MGQARSPLPLPAFSFDWVGGDIVGLSALAGQCYQIAPEITAADSALSGQVSDIADAGGWKGAAASAFASAWDKDSGGNAPKLRRTQATPSCALTRRRRGLPPSRAARLAAP
jgi:hypothetical protein